MISTLPFEHSIECMSGQDGLLAIGTTDKVLFYEQVIEKKLGEVGVPGKCTGLCFQGDHLLATTDSSLCKIDIKEFKLTFLFAVHGIRGFLKSSDEKIWCFGKNGLFGRMSEGMIKMINMETGSDFSSATMCLDTNGNEFICLGSSFCRIFLYDVGKDKLMKPIIHNNRLAPSKSISITTVCMTGPGLILSGDSIGDCCLWDINQPDHFPKVTIPIPSGNPISSIIAHYDQYIVSDVRGNVYLLNIESDECLELIASNYSFSSGATCMVRHCGLCMVGTGIYQLHVIE